jgi:uncharacterized repeat protein (TIGR01451 family)
MKKLHLLGVSVATGVVMTAVVVAPVFAWHPKGVIKKSVQNVTANGQVADANDAKTAVTAKTGDTLKYVIEVSNAADQASNGYNDMAFTVMSDTLPAGVELVNNPSQRTITENLGTLKPGQKVTKEYAVRVTSNVNKDVVTNKACFTGDSEVKDNPQKGCDNAVVVVTVPQTLPPVTTGGEGGPVETPQVLPATLPATGPAGAVSMVAGVTGLSAAAHAVVTRKKRQ